MKTFETKREQLFSGPLHRGKTFHYVTYLAGEKIATGESKEESERSAVQTLLGAYRCQTASIYASVTADGHVVTTREYAPGQVEFAHHRDADGCQGGSMMSNLELLDDDYTKRRVTVREFHAHYLTSYNTAITTRVA